MVTWQWNTDYESSIDLALGYIFDIMSLVHNFIRGLLKTCCADDRVLTGLLSVMMEEMTTRYKNAIHHVKFLLIVEREGTLLTANHYFSDNLEKWYVAIDWHPIGPWV